MAREMTPNQVVAWNLWRERKSRGLSIEEMSSRLAQHGVTWEKATYYAAEASRSPEKSKRRFSADELLAFALAFEIPLVSFLVPPNNATLVLDDLDVPPGRLMEAGIDRNVADLRPIAGQLRAAATAIEAFEEARQPRSAARAIAEHAASAPEHLQNEGCG